METDGQRYVNEHHVECPWCRRILTVTLESWIDEDGRPRSRFRNTEEQAAAIKADWDSHAEQRRAERAGEIEAPPLRLGWRVGAQPIEWTTRKRWPGMTSARRPERHGRSLTTKCAGASA